MRPDDRLIVDGIGGRIAAWLKRIYPRNGAKLAAQDFDVSPHTTRRWFEGKLPENKHLALMQARWGKPFIAFITEPVVGPWPELDPSTSPDLSAETVRGLVRAVLDELDRRDELDRFFWCTGEGDIEEAPAGLEERARRAMGAPAHLEMDFGQYMRRNHGWAALTRSADGAVTIHYSERRLRSATADAVCRWLADERRPAAITRVVDLGVSEVRARHADRGAAIAALQQAAIITTRGKGRPWSVRRLPLDAITDPGFADLMKAWTGAPADIVRATAAIDGFKQTSVFRVDDGGDVWSQIVGTSFGLPAHQFEGRRVLERGDTAYGAMIAERIKLSLAEPTLHELTGSVGGVPVRYRNLSMPEQGTGRVVSASRVLERA